MTGEKITQDELMKMFGDRMPWQAFNLLANADGSKTVGEIRDELRTLAGPPARWKAREIIAKLCSDPEMWGTHGCPGVVKLKLLEDEFTAAIEAASSKGSEA